MIIRIIAIAFLLSGCAVNNMRHEQTEAAANIYHAMLALDKGVSAKEISKGVKKQAVLIAAINGDTIKGASDGN